jgi:uncharacterized protein (TIGR03905 family)
MIYKTQDVCSEEIHVEVDGGVIKNVSFVKGCPGNLLGIAQLVKGLSPQEVIDRFSGIKCGKRQTSCPDQLAQALRKLVQEG